MKKIPTNSFENMRIASIIFIVIGLVPIAILLSASIAVLFNDGFTTFIYALIVAIIFSAVIDWPAFISKKSDIVLSDVKYFISPNHSINRDLNPSNFDLSACSNIVAKLS